MIIPQSLFRWHSWTWPLALPKISSVLMAYFNCAALDMLSGVYGFSDRSQGFYILLGHLQGNSGEKNHPFYFCRGQNWEQPTRAAAASVQPAHPAAPRPPPSQHSTQLIRHCFFFFLTMSPRFRNFFSFVACLFDLYFRKKNRRKMKKFCRFFKQAKRKKLIGSPVCINILYKRKYWW